MRKYIFSDTCSLISASLEEALEEVLESRSCFWGQCVAVVGDTLYVGENQENVIYRIDTVRDTYESIIPEGIVSGFAGITYQAITYTWFHV